MSLQRLDKSGEQRGHLVCSCVCCLDNVDTPISPELLPGTESGEILQVTENLVGPYELHDFFNQQFKRSCLPDGPAIGSVSLSPRGAWTMPSDAWSTMFSNDIN